MQKLNQFGNNIVKRKKLNLVAEQYKVKKKSLKSGESS